MACRKKFLCLDCARDTSKIGELYMLLDEVWFLALKNKKGMLCVKCIEIRLGRPLNKADFNNSYLNKSRSFNRSTLLITRLTQNV